MPLRIVDEIKVSASSAIRQASLLSAMVLALVIAAGFLFAAAFVVVSEHYGPLVACLVLTGIFLLFAVIAGIIYAVRKHQDQERARQRRAKAAQLLADPLVVTTGLQVVRAIGLKRLIPLLAVGGVAIGYFMTRGAAQDEAPAE
jgi:uncharacterized membrane protein